MTEWRNWAGDQACSPARTERPRSRDELAEIVGTAGSEGRRVRVAGTGHSFTEAAMTDDTMLRMEGLDRILEADTESGLVRVEGGVSIRSLNRGLDALGLAMENLGDIDAQTITGAISTGTHGTGATYRNISAQVEEVELVTANGEARLLGPDSGPLLQAARVGVGSLGVISTVTLRTVPAFVLHRVDKPRPLGEVLDRYHELAEGADHFEFFVFPYTETALTITRNRSERPGKPRSRAAAYVSDVVLEEGVGEILLKICRARHAAIPYLTRTSAYLLSQGERYESSFGIFANRRQIRFTEMEYAIPREHGPEAIARVMEMIKAEKMPTPMPIECRMVAGDDALLSPAHERDTAYIAVHQYREMDWRPYFTAVEEIMDDYGGRPHWGKRHLQTAATLRDRYPRWDDFAAARDELDPNRTFTNEYAERVLGP